MFSSNILSYICLLRIKVKQKDVLWMHISPTFSWTYPGCVLFLHTRAEVKLSECEPSRDDEEYDGSDTICLATAV